MPTLPTLHLKSSSARRNRTIVPRDGAVTDLENLGYESSLNPWYEEISNLPGGLKYASDAKAIEFQYSFVIRADDPNAGEFARTQVGGGRRADICGNK